MVKDLYVARNLLKQDFTKILFQAECRKNHIWLAVRPLITAFAMSNEIIVDQECRVPLPEDLHRRFDPEVYCFDVGLPLVELQVRSFLVNIWKDALRRTLNDLQALLRMHGERSQYWFTAFLVLLLLAMTLDECQNITYHLYGESGRALYRSESETIYKHFSTICGLFELKFSLQGRNARLTAWYDKGCTPRERKFLKILALSVNNNRKLLS